MNRFKSIRSRMLAWLLIPTLLLFLIGIALLINQFREFTVSHIENTYVRLTEARAAELGQWLQSRMDEIGAVAERDSVRSLTDIGDELREFRDKRLDVYESIFLTRKNGDVVARSDGSPLGINLSHRKYYTDIFERGNDITISNPVVSTSTRNLIVVIVHAVKNRHDQTIGMFGATVNLHTLSEIVTQLDSDSLGDVWIVDGAGMVIAHHDAGIRMQLNILQSQEKGYSGLAEAGHKMLAGEKGRMEYITRPNGEKAMLVYEPIPNSPNWTLGVSLWEADVFRDVNRMTAGSKR